ncbi:MAG TPA: radical SAM protein [Syntrophorhabdaceae bacterium]|nr:radical SAM protein [Syntrophorhabdaceae bacterium]HRR72375.1 radical SAM protein [Syntrophorhabdaceae bacterium]
MIQKESSAEKVLYNHPCFYGSAKARWGRIHLPVARRCNIQCNFCNRRYDCANEGRPGVTSFILEPELVLDYLKLILKGRNDISVIGIAGPGDPMCEPETTLEILNSISLMYPQMILCISTNGLNLEEYIDDLQKIGVTHITITINAVDPVIGEKLYRWVRYKNKTYHGYKASEILINRQKEAINKVKSKDFTLKINTVVIPGVNDMHIEDIAYEVAEMGADIMNCIPMIPVADTPFESIDEPCKKTMNRIRDLASRYVPQMYHCTRCRADAVGILDFKKCEIRTLG